MPCSTVRTSWSATPSSNAIAPIPWLMPKPRLQMSPGRELEQRAAPDHLAHVERERVAGRGRPPQGARVVGRVRRDVGLGLVGVDEHVVDQRAGHVDRARRQRAGAGELLDLGDHDAAAVAGGHRHGEHLAAHGLVVQRQAAVGVRRAAPDHRHVDRERVVEQPLPSAQGDDLDEVLGRARVLLAAGVARIDVRVEPDVRDEAGPAAGDLAAQQREHALRERIGLELAGLDERAERRLVADVAADRAPHQPGERELGEARGRRSRRSRRRGRSSGRADARRGRTPRRARR